MLKKKDLFKNKLLLIYGFGKSGKACFNFLNKKNSIKIFDDKVTLANNKFKKFYISKKKITETNFDYIIISPGINIKKCSLNTYLYKNQNKIINELDIFYLKNKKNLKITITGTNGKSTTAKLIYEVLKKHGKDARLVGNIGNPLLNEKKINLDTIFVIEASSYQIEYSKFFQTKFAIILNISPDHLERHETMKKYVKAKFKIIKRQSKDDFALIQNKNKYLENEIHNNKVKSKIIRVKPNYNKLSKKVKNDYFLNINNLNNLNFVIHLSKLLNLKSKKIFEIVRNFKSLDFRQQLIYKNKKFLIINDSKSTSFSSSINLLKSYKNIYWIVGGQFKKGDKFTLEKKYFKNIKAYIFGNKKNFFIKNLENKIKIKCYKKIIDCLVQIKKDAQVDDNFPITILFSPSAASFDQFLNFEKRGIYFNECIKKINFIKNINAK